MSQDNQVFVISTTMYGYLYTVYAKEDIDRKKILYTGEISEDSKHCNCECDTFVSEMNCYHQDLAKKIMEVPNV